MTVTHSSATAHCKALSSNLQISVENAPLLFVSVIIHVVSREGNSLKVPIHQLSTVQTPHEHQLPTPSNLFKPILVPFLDSSKSRAMADSADRVYQGHLRFEWGSHLLGDSTVREPDSCAGPFRLSRFEEHATRSPGDDPSVRNFSECLVPQDME